MSENRSVHSALPDEEIVEKAFARIMDLKVARIYEDTPGLDCSPYTPPSKEATPSHELHGDNSPAIEQSPFNSEQSNPQKESDLNSKQSTPS
jgi:hypothetical protein